MPLRPQVRQLQAAGRRGDELLGHLTPGELVLPQSLQSPSVVAAIAQDARRKGINPSSLMAGSKFSSVNPATGLPEFHAIFEPLPEPDPEDVARKQALRAGDTSSNELTGFNQLLQEIVDRALAISGEPGPQLPGAAAVDPGPAVPPGTEVPFFFDQVTDFNKFGFGPEAILRDPNLIPGTNVTRGGTTAGVGGGTIVDLSDFFEVDRDDDGDDDFGEEGEFGGGKTGTETETGVSGAEATTEGGPSFGGITGKRAGKTIGGLIGGVFGGPLGSAIGSAIGSQIGSAVDPLGEFATTFGEIGGPVGPSPRQDFNVAFTGKGAVGSIDGIAGFDPGFGSFEDIGEFGEPGGEGAAAAGEDPEGGFAGDVGEEETGTEDPEGGLSGDIGEDAEPGGETDGDGTDEGTDGQGDEEGSDFDGGDGEPSDDDFDDSSDTSADEEADEEEDEDEDEDEDTDDDTDDSDDNSDDN